MCRLVRRFRTNPGGVNRLSEGDPARECTSSTSTYTSWHLTQDGVNHLHAIHRRISAVRGAGEVRTHVFNHPSCQMSDGYVIGRFGFRKLISTPCSRERARAEIYDAGGEKKEKNLFHPVNLCNGILFALIPHVKPCFVFMRECRHFPLHHAQLLMLHFGIPSATVGQRREASA